MAERELVQVGYNGGAYGLHEHKWEADPSSAVRSALPRAIAAHARCRPVYEVSEDAGPVSPGPTPSDETPSHHDHVGCDEECPEHSLFGPSRHD